MSERPWWATIIQWTFNAIVMTVMIDWLSRSRFKQRRKEELGTLRHPYTTLVTGVLGFAFGATFTVILALTSNPTATWWMPWIFVGVAAYFVTMIVDYFTTRHRISDDGLAYRRFLGTTGFVRWSDLRKVRYRSTLKWFQLESTHGSVVRISAMLMGFPEFAQALLKAAPPEATDAPTLAVLQATADGDPPSLWG